MSDDSEKSREEKLKAKKEELKKKAQKKMKKNLQMDNVEDLIKKRDVRKIKEYSSSVLKKFTKYIKSIVIWGSTVTKKGKKETSDIDVAIIVDDTDVKKMSRKELKEKLFNKLVKRAYPISEKIHPQPYLLTEFWQYMREGNPVIYNVLRDGVVVYDKGFFKPLQILMKKGEINPTRESIDKHMHVSEKILKNSEKRLLKKMTKDYERAIVSGSQAVLMELGYRPPTPKEIPGFVEDVLLEKEGMVSEDVAETAEKVISVYKDVEHGERNEIDASEIGDMREKVKDYIEKMKELLNEIRKEKGDEHLYKSIEEKKKEMEEEEEKEKVKRDGVVKSDSEKAETSGKDTSKMAKEELGRR